jgi:hypothetical protein
MPLPRAIQAQIEQADQIVNELNGVAPPEGETPAPGTPEPQLTAAPEPIEPAPPVTPPAPEENWERKFHSLQGKYDAEVPRLSQQVRDMGQQLQALIAENTQLKAAPAPAAPAAKQEVLVTDKDTEAFGSDLIDLADRIAKQNMAVYEADRRAMAAEIKELKGMVGSVGQKQQMTTEQVFWRDLGSAVPDWEAINKDQAFIAWLGEVDPVYGMPRQAGVDNAFDRLDAPRMAAIFNAYKTLTGTARPPKTPSQELSSQVAPTRSRNTPAPTGGDAPQGKVWSQQEIADFYNAKRRGYMDDKEAARTEQEIESAVAEGRVR